MYILQKKFTVSCTVISTLSIPDVCIFSFSSFDSKCVLCLCGMCVCVWGGGGEGETSTQLTLLEVLNWEPNTTFVLSACLVFLGLETGRGGVGWEEMFTQLTVGQKHQISIFKVAYYWQITTLSAGWHWHAKIPRVQLRCWIHRSHGEGAKCLLSSSHGKCLLYWVKAL